MTTADKPKGDPDPPGTLTSLQRGLQILDMVVAAGEPVRLVQVARHFAMDRASAFRFLQTLERNGLVAKDPERKSYTVGGRLLHWVARLGHDARIAAVARPALERLVRATNESGHFGILSNGQALLLDYIGSKGMVVVQNRVGVHEPLYCTALGKVLLAFQPPERRQTLIEGLHLKRHTKRTLIDRARLERQLAQVRKEAVAYDDGEYNELLYCVASPVLGSDGLPLGAIGVSIVHPLAARDPERIERVAADVRRHARELTATLAGTAVAAAAFGMAEG